MINSHSSSMFYNFWISWCGRLARFQVLDEPICYTWGWLPLGSGSDSSDIEKNPGPSELEYASALKLADTMLQDVNGFDDASTARMNEVWDMLKTSAPSRVSTRDLWTLIVAIVASHRDLNDDDMCQPLGCGGPEDNRDYADENYQELLKGENGFIDFATYYTIRDEGWPIVDEASLYSEPWELLAFLLQADPSGSFGPQEKETIGTICGILDPEAPSYADRRNLYELHRKAPYVSRSAIGERVCEYLFCAPASRTPADDEIMMSLIKPLAECAAAAESRGLHHSLAVEASVLANRDLLNNDGNPYAISGLRTTIDIHDEYVRKTASLRSVLGWISFWWMQYREFMATEMPYIIDILDAVGRLQEKMNAAIVGLLAIFASIILTILERYTGMNRADVLFATSAALDIMSLADPRHRVNQKAVWALLWYRARASMSRAEEFFFSLPLSNFRPSRDYQDWSSRMFKLLSGVKGADTNLLSINPPSREVFYPSETYGLDEYESLVDKERTVFIETDRERRRLIQSRALGNSTAIDQAFLATAATTQASLDRYVVPRPVVAVEDRMLLTQAADAMYEQYRELYALPKPMTVEAVMKASVWKYSAGLPFLPVIRKRATLQQTAWYAAINRAAQSILQGGIFPEVGFHGFPKNQVVALSKLECRANLRTVTAGDRITMTAFNTLLLERNKRVAPVDYNVFNQLPRREGAFSDVLQSLATMPHFVTGDGRKFDSTVASEVATIGSVRLYERGIQEAGIYNERAAVSIVHAYYEAVCFGLVVNLMDGTVIRKNGGGGTGSAATTPDNRDWTRLVMIASFAKTFNLPASDFFKHVVFGNASDDLAMGLSELAFSGLREWQANIRNMYGVEFSFQVEKQPTNVLHLEAHVLTESDFDMYDEVGTTPPPIPLRHSPPRLMLMRSAYRGDRMTTNVFRATQYLVEMATGQALLTAHSPETYSIIAQDYMEAATEHMAVFVTDFSWNVGYSPEGHINSVHPNYGTEPTARLLRLAAKRVGGSASMDDPLTSERVHNIFRANKRWLSARPLKSYRDVFYSWTKPEDWNRRRPAHRRWDKVIPYARFATPFSDLIRLGLVKGQRFMDAIPASVKSLHPEANELSFSRPFLSYDYIVELFIFRRFLFRNGRLPSDSEMRAEVRKSPFASATDLQSFLIRLSDSRVLRIWASVDRSKLTGEDAMHWVSNDAIQGRLLVMLGWYTIIDIALNAFARVPFLGVFVLLFTFWVRYLDQVYSILGLMFWVSTGTASIAIANVAPRDKYLVQKQFAAVLAGLTPRFFTDYWIGSFWIFSQLEVAVDAFVYLWHTRSVVETQVLKALSAESNPWIPVLASAGVHLIELSVDLLTGGTGLGKSTSMVATLSMHFHEPRILLLVPYNVLVQNYVNEFMPLNSISLFRAGTPFEPIPETKVVVATYAAALGDPAILDWASFVLGDEFHAAPFSVVIIRHLLGRKKFLAVTATPVGILCSELKRVITAPTIERFVRTEEVIEKSMEDVLQNLFTYLPRPDSRVLVIHPNLTLLTTWAQAIEGIGITTSIVSAEGGDPSSGQVVLATSVVDNGINVIPAPDLLIDSGYTVRRCTRTGPREALLRNTYRLELGPSPTHVQIQRSGRVGRISRGHVIRLLKTSGGPELISVDWAHYLRYIRTIPCIKNSPVSCSARAAGPDEAPFIFEQGLSDYQKVKCLMAVVLVSTAGGLQPAARPETWAITRPDSTEGQARKNAHSAACAALRIDSIYPNELINFSIELSRIGLAKLFMNRTIYVYGTFWYVTSANTIGLV